MSNQTNPSLDVNTINIITLAYLGDAIYETYIREYFIKQGIAKVEELQKKVCQYVSAKGQAKILKELLDKKELTTEEIDVVTRGRNNKRSNHPKHTDIITYKHSTGFEALIGYLYLSNQTKRLTELLNKIEVI